MGKTAVVFTLFLSALFAAGCSWSDADLSRMTSTTIPREQTTEEVALPGSGRTFYVSADAPNASDENSGLSPTYQGNTEGPWATIQHATSTMVAGDTACIRAGTYFESGITFAHSGTSGSPISLIACDDKQVVIDGSKATSKSSGIEFLTGQGHYALQGLTIRSMPRSGISTHDDTREVYRDITIRDCILHDNGLSGIRLAAVDGFLVENVETYANGYYGLDVISSHGGDLSPSNGLVTDSSFHHHTGREGHGLAINQGHDIAVSDCVAYHNTIHGFDVSDWPKRGELSHDITFERNASYDNGVAGFAINSDSHHVVYHKNLAWQNGADWAEQGTSSGFLCYEGCWHVAYYHNVSAANTDAGFAVTDDYAAYSQPEDSLIVLKNNIAYDNGRPEWEVRLALLVEGKAWQVVAEHNNWYAPVQPDAIVVAINLVGEDGLLYSASQINEGAFQEGNLSVDPSFAAPETGDFRLSPDSPLIDAGVDIGEPYCGNAPDIGAGEVCP